MTRMVPVNVPAWAAEAVKKRAAISGRTPEREAGVIIDEALPVFSAGEPAGGITRHVGRVFPPLAPSLDEVIREALRCERSTSEAFVVRVGVVASAGQILPTAVDEALDTGGLAE